MTCTCVDDMMKRKAHLMCSVYVVDSVCTRIMMMMMMMMMMCVFLLYVIITVVIAIAIFIVRHLCPIIKQLLLL